MRHSQNLPSQLRRDEASLMASDQLNPTQLTPTPQASSPILLTVLGMNPQSARYALHGATVEAKLAPLALVALLPPEQQPKRVVALCTPEAKVDSWPILHQALGDSCSVEAVDVPSDYSQDAINTFLTKATAAIPPNATGRLQISIDMTHGFRHFSFLTYLAGLYLVSLRDVELSGAWHGLLQRNAESPFLDLKPLLALPRWIHALQVLRDTGSALPLAEALQAGVEGQLATGIARELRQISEAYLSALPLELGYQVQRFSEDRLTDRKAITKVLRSNHQLPLAPELVSLLDQLLQPFIFEDQVKGKTWKRGILLTPFELQRQARLIDDLFAREDDGMALGLLDEWTVSWALWCLDDTANWLDFKVKRRKAASQLGAIAAACQNPSLKALLTPEQIGLGDFSHLLTNLRNGFHHHGMRPEVLVGEPKSRAELTTVKTYWHETLKALPRFGLALGEGSTGAVLVSPIGNRPGVLFSAMQACRQRCNDDLNACLVICSSHSAALIQEAATKANYGGTILPLVLQDPYGGLAEIARLQQEAQQTLVRASEVQVNVTGGTTLMGLAAQALADQARQLARPVQRFGLIDRRSPSEQEADPYQLGEPFWLNSHTAEVSDGNPD